MTMLYVYVAVAIILTLLFLGHVAVYFFVVSVFTLSPTVIHLLEALTLILPLCFMGSLILSEWVMNNAFSRWFYRLSAGWLCFFLYFLLSAALHGVFGLFGAPAVLGQVLVVISVLVSVYGIRNAQKLVTVRHLIELPNLPLLWQNKKIVFISDLHLGQIRTKKFAAKVVDQIEKESPDIVLVGGDVFDGAVGDPVELASPFRELKSAFGTLVIFGNHEEFEDNTRFKDAFRFNNMRLLEDEALTIEGLQFVGVDYKTTLGKENFKNVLNLLSIDRSLPSILLKHVPSFLEVAQEQGISLSLHGHTHRAQAWPLSIITHLIFKGYDYGLKKVKNMMVYTSSGVGTWGPPVRVGSHCEIVVLTLQGAR